MSCKGVIVIDLIGALQEQIYLCRKNKNYKCGVYVETEERRRIVMDVVKNLIPEISNDVRLRLGSCCAEVEFSNWSFLKIVRVNNGARANRFNGLIVDNEIGREDVNYIVLPTLKPILLEGNTIANDSPVDRVFYVGISYDDVTKSKNNQLLYLSSARGDGKSEKRLKTELDILLDSFTNEINFKKEYECMFYENNYDRPVVEKEVNEDKVLLYEAWGIPKDMITYSTEFVNKTKQTYLNIAGKFKNGLIGFENDINVHLRIDTNIYDGYEVHIEDGLVTVVLHEIKNEAPALKDYGACQE